MKRWDMSVITLNKIAISVPLASLTVCFIVHFVGAGSLSLFHTLLRSI